MSAGSPQWRNRTRMSSGSAPRSSRSRTSRASTRPTPSPCGAPRMVRPWAVATHRRGTGRLTGDPRSPEQRPAPRSRRPAGRQIVRLRGPVTSRRSPACAAGRGPWRWPRRADADDSPASQARVTRTDRRAAGRGRGRASAAGEGDSQSRNVTWSNADSDAGGRATAAATPRRPSPPRPRRRACAAGRR